ncbi:MAG: FMN-binding protein [Myxococcales bacterium]|nr:FMN-binding protein [Myxococcales bacterium]
MSAASTAPATPAAAAELPFRGVALRPVATIALRPVATIALRRVACVALAAGAFLVPVVANADVFWDKPSVLKSFFATSQRVTYKHLQPTPEQAAALLKRTGRAPGDSVTVYFGVTHDQVDGVAVIDDERGQHEPITFAALVGPDGALRRVEVMVYREAYGDAVREARFRRQFVGKTTADPVRHGEDIVAVAGATISSRALATGARRALHLVDELVLKPGVARSLGVARKVAAADTGRPSTATP